MSSNYRALWKKHRSEIPRGWHIHHLDGNHSNNDIDNLICVSPRMHYDIHYNQWLRYGKKKDMYAANMLVVCVEDDYVPAVGDPDGWKEWNNKVKSGEVKHPSLGTKWTKERRELTMKNRKTNHPVTFRGIEYYSIRECERETGISRYLIRKEINDL